VSVRRLVGLLALSGLLIAGPGLAAEADRTGVTVAHRLTVGIDPAARQLAVDDRLLLLEGGAVEFLLNRELEISASEPPVEEVPLGDVTPFFGNNSGEGSAAGLRRYRVRLPEGGGKLHLTYSGKFDFGLGTQQEEYQRGFRETAGIVSPEGVYLAGNGHWYPQFTHPAGETELVEFELTAHSPEGWQLVSQGNGTSRDEQGFARWSSAGKMDEIYLVGGPLVRYRQTVPAAAGVAAGTGASAVEAEVYLRQPDEALAGRYLAATAQYLEMYSRLIGPYPYGKFALVENFWETGLGMASFTLLGPQVIRMPFIVTTSYPHEILHNWWGNGVLVDYASGNWCEGLTAYMADHLMAEQRGQGEAYRRDRLQDYRSYVREGRDFPLTEFRSRHSAATEAVGYGKTMMGFHMLRRRMGDDRFREWAARFYREERGRTASFADVRRAIASVIGDDGGIDLGRFFRDWTERPGAAALAVEAAEVVAIDGGFEVRGTLRQTQDGEPFALDVPVAVQGEGGEAVASNVRLASAAAPFTIRVASRPVLLQVDPSFDLFRRLDPREIPPSIGQIFGEPRLLAVVAAQASPEERAAWKTLLESWRSDAHSVEIVTDAELAASAELPADRAVWLLGRGNRLAPRYFGGGAVAGLTVDDAGVGFDGQRLPFAGHTTVAVVRHPLSAERAIGWITVDPALLAALPGFGRKLPHYGKYSYLGFEGSEPTNMLKGQWAAADSPLRIDLRVLRPAPERVEPLPALVLPPRPALADLPAN